VRGDTAVVSRILALGLVVGTAAPLVAQQATAKESPAAAQAAANAKNAAKPQQLEQMKTQARSFEALLREAVTQSGRELSEWANRFAPVVLQPAVLSPVVRNMLLPQGGIGFTVEIS
jgi:pyruvate/2-oxoglutarate dehydrogenase complex dihydrolipoamide acyltransferase (E2) component